MRKALELTELINCPNKFQCITYLVISTHGSGWKRSMKLLKEQSLEVKSKIFFDKFMPEGKTYSNVPRD